MNSLTILFYCISWLDQEDAVRLVISYTALSIIGSLAGTLWHYGLI
jgi:hypothetical protein